MTEATLREHRSEEVTTSVSHYLLSPLLTASDRPFTGTVATERPTAATVSVDFDDG